MPINNISRRSFLKGITAVSASCVIPTVLAENCINDISMSEFSRCKNDILYFAERYVKLQTIDKKQLKLYNVQKEYLKNLTLQRLFVCKKCRQAGITTMNKIYIAWKAMFFENQNIDVVFNRYNQCLNAFMDLKSLLNSFSSVVSDEHFKSDTAGWLGFRYVLQNGNTIRYMVYEGFVDSSSIAEKDNTIILDEMAYCNRSDDVDVVNTCQRRFVKECNAMVAVSTPCFATDLFASLYDRMSDQNRMTITIDDLPRAVYKPELRASLGNSAFNRECLCEV